MSFFKSNIRILNLKKSDFEKSISQLNLGQIEKKFAILFFILKIISLKLKVLENLQKNIKNTETPTSILLHKLGENWRFSFFLHISLNF